MNWVDIIVLAVIAVSAWLAFMRGFVREALGMGAWVGAAALAILYAPGLEPRVGEWIGSPGLTTPVTFFGVFVGALIVLSVAAAMVSHGVHSVGLGSVDRSLGVLFGLVRGAFLVVVLYIIAGNFSVSTGSWPLAIQHSQALPITAQGAAWLMGKIPSSMLDRLPPLFRPHLPTVPGQETRAADLLQLPAKGRPTDRP